MKRTLRSSQTVQEVAFGSEEEQRHNFCSTRPKHDVWLQEAGLHVTLQLQDAEVLVPNVHQKACAHYKSNPYKGCAAFPPPQADASCFSPTHKCFLLVLSKYF